MIRYSSGVTVGMSIFIGVDKVQGYNLECGKTFAYCIWGR